MNIHEQALTKLKCARCHLYLSVGPITSSSGNNFSCGRCPSGGAQVKIYEVLAENFAFPCRYSSFGCQSIIKWGSVKTHEENCFKKPHLCPAVPTGICLWRGAITDIRKHFDQHHSDEVTDRNIIEIKLHENVEGCKLLKIGDKENYIFHVYFNRTQKLLKLNVMQLNDIKSFNAQKYQIKLHAHDFSKSIKLATNQLQPYDTMDHNNIKDENIIDMNVLKFLTNDNPSVFCDINLNVDKKYGNKELVKFLECPVCNEYMGSPIYQCHTGHSFCNLCISKLNDCPLCHKELTSTRNYALEDLANQVTHHCKNQDLGCAYGGSFDEVKMHQETCGYYKCPLEISQNCTWHGNFEDLIVHCRNNHIYLETENYGLLCSLTVDNRGVFRLIYADGVFFRICRKYVDEEFYVIVQFVGPSNKATDYLYEFTLVAISNNETELCFKDTCQILQDDAHSFDNCFKIPFSILKIFEKNNKLKCNVKIIKRNKYQEELTV